MDVKNFLSNANHHSEVNIASLLVLPLKKFPKMKNKKLIMKICLREYASGISTST